MIDMAIPLVKIKPTISYNVNEESCFTKHCIFTSVIVMHLKIAIL